MDPWMPRRGFRPSGFDSYSLFFLVLLVLFGGAGRFYPPMLIPAAIVFLYLLFRVFSKDREKRQFENARFLALLHRVARWLRRGQRVMRPDPQYTYFKCPTCGQPMRVPRGLGQLQITCRACGSDFGTKS